MYFHFSILKKLKGKTLRNGSNGDFSQLTLDCTACGCKAAEARMEQKHVAATFLWVIKKKLPGLLL